MKSSSLSAQADETTPDTTSPDSGIVVESVLEDSDLDEDAASKGTEGTTYSFSESDNFSERIFLGPNRCRVIMAAKTSDNRQVVCSHLFGVCTRRNHASICTDAKRVAPIGHYTMTPSSKGGADCILENFMSDKEMQQEKLQHLEQDRSIPKQLFSPTGERLVKTELTSAQRAPPPAEFTAIPPESFLMEETKKLPVTVAKGNLKPAPIYLAMVKGNPKPAPPMGPPPKKPAPVIAKQASSGTTPKPASRSPKKTSRRFSNPTTKLAQLMRIMIEDFLRCSTAINKLQQETKALPAPKFFAVRKGALTTVGQGTDQLQKILAEHPEASHQVFDTEKEAHQWLANPSGSLAISNQELSTAHKVNGPTYISNSNPSSQQQATASEKPLVAPTLDDLMHIRGNGPDKSTGTPNEIFRVKLMDRRVTEAMCPVGISTEGASECMHAMPDVVALPVLKMSERVLIIGGHGYVGSVVTGNMIKLGRAVTVVDRQPVDENTITGGYTHIQCSVDQMYDQGVDVAVFDVIIFLGGITHPSAATSMGYVYRDALFGFGRLVDELKSEQCFIYASSAGVYANTNGKMAEESDSLPEAINLYDYTKRCMDLAAEMYGGRKKIYGLRLASVCGYSPKFRKAPILNGMICDAVNKREVTVANEAKNRSVVGFQDLCRVLNVIIDKGTIEDSGIYNIGSFNATVGELAKMVAERYPCVIKTNDGNDRSPYDFLLNSKKFEEVFSFTFSDNFESIALSLEPLLANETDKKKNPDFVRILECRVCHAPNLVSILDLGLQPLANPVRSMDISEKKFPLRLVLCTRCHLASLDVVVNPKILFRDYSYVSGTTKTGAAHFDKFATKYTEEMGIGSVLDIACNDGSQLNYFKSRGWKTYGVDPAENLRPIAVAKGHEVTTAFWNCNLARTMKVKFDLVVAQNVFAHLHDVHDFLDAVAIVLQDSGTFTIQTSQAEMFHFKQFDTIYHEHLSFFNVRSMKCLVSAHGFNLKRVKKVPIHGCSYIFDLTRAELTKDQQQQVDQFEESEKLLYSMDIYKEFSSSCRRICVDLKNTLLDYVNVGMRVVGYGAAAKGMTVINAACIGTDLCEFIVDENPLKTFLYTPGTHIPIYPPAYLEDRRLPNRLVIVVFAWNFLHEIVRKCVQIRPEANDIFITYFPKTHVTDPITLLGAEAVAKLRQ